MQTGRDQGFLAGLVDHGIQPIQAPRGLGILNGFHFLTQGQEYLDTIAPVMPHGISIQFQELEQLLVSSRHEQTRQTRRRAEEIVTWILIQPTGAQRGNQITGPAPVCGSPIGDSKVQGICKSSYL